MVAKMRVQNTTPVTIAKTFATIGNMSMLYPCVKLG
jgi:hypothetical protein